MSADDCELAEKLGRIADRLRAKLEEECGGARANELIARAVLKEHRRAWRREHPDYVPRRRRSG